MNKEKNFIQLEYKKLLVVLLIFLNKLNYYEKCYNDKLLKSVACILYISGRAQPRRVALVNMASFLSISDKSDANAIFLYSSFDDLNIRNRLEPLNHFSGGNRKIINRGMDLLTLVMIQDYIANKKNDEIENKYNPINSRKWNGEELQQKGIKRIKKIDCPEMGKNIFLARCFKSELLVYYWLKHFIANERRKSAI